MRWLVGDKETARALCKAALEFGRSLPGDVRERSYPMHLPMLMLATVEDYECIPHYRGGSREPQALGPQPGRRVDRPQGRGGPLPNGAGVRFGHRSRDRKERALRLAAKVNQALLVKAEPVVAIEGDRYHRLRRSWSFRRG